MRLEPVIGLEIHLQLKTASKMFTNAMRVEDMGTAPNTAVNAVVLGHPGTLPVPNRQAMLLGVRAGLALQATINPIIKFDRKHYFYPDLPKGYQISQYDKPIASGGFLDVDVPDNSLPERKTIRVHFERLHLEEDAAKLQHGADGESYVDYNRAGAPLAETVTKPDLRSPEEARAFLQEFRRIMRELGVSDADMEKGNMRCDINVSLRPVDEHGVPTESSLRPKTEVKNVNSFRSVERALYYEIDRQTALWEMNTPPSESSTRGWNEEKGITELQRVKEGASDYRYFPDPDLPPFDISELVAEARQSQVELPAAKRARFMQEYFLSDIDARTLTDTKALGTYFEQVVSEFLAWSKEPMTAEVSKHVSGWLLSKLGGLLKEQGITWDQLASRITAENFAELLKIIWRKETTGTNALVILTDMLSTGGDPSDILTAKGLGRIADAGAMQALAEKVIAAYPKQVADFVGGKEPVLKFLVGMAMKESGGNADAALVEQAIRTQLGK